MMDNVQTTKPHTTATVDDPLQKLADAGNWDELAQTAEAIALYNTRTLFIAALELAARGNHSEAMEAAANLNPPMAALIRAIVEDDISILLNSSGKKVISDAWCSLAEPVATRASKAAAMKYASLATIVTEAESLSAVANYFFINRCWKPAAYIYEEITKIHNDADIDTLRQLGISRYLSKDYTGAIIAFGDAIDMGDTSPETLSYVTWLQEKFDYKEECDNE